MIKKTKKVVNNNVKNNNNILLVFVLTNVVILFTLYSLFEIRMFAKVAGADVLLLSSFDIKASKDNVQNAEASPISVDTSVINCTNLIDNGPYYTELCSDGGGSSGVPSVTVLQPEANARCRLMFHNTTNGTAGSENDWNLATVPNKGAAEKISEINTATSGNGKTVATKNKTSWLGGGCADKKGEWRWRYGPLAGVQFFSGFDDKGKAVHKRYADFAVTTFHSIKSYYPILGLGDYVFFKDHVSDAANGDWRNTGNDQKSAVICEKVYYKCFEKGTLTSSGRNGNNAKDDDSEKKNITCTCKEGYSGKLCNTVVVPDGGDGYKYTYYALCGIGRSWQESKLFTVYGMLSWVTPTTDTQLMGVKKLTGTSDSAWLPAYYKLNVNKWQWAEGPFKDTDVKLSGLPSPSSVKIDKYLLLNGNDFRSGDFDDLQSCVIWQDRRSNGSDTSTTTTKTKPRDKLFKMTQTSLVFYLTFVYFFFWSLFNFFHFY